ncbi:hypothetical protein A2331_06040 [Candidatus Falkowbacteria bacterium RIFOXYB2_FULL_34_18]|uniref:Uncharacterized protein n=1 Tax=Candidatus Falkowbacteria bacterium RIFOXYD2_FULL_34_120 TaxID=1798007 RepID=A0A1F5TPG8_9BACT|nr:MAG: hypothetical protein A2331_06040 [Candidatus Falkowbacteria bacterium RIFOXYB2_FULL_34_18]OGF29052.1 MAG: hypothetical protein A2500_03355 [Candidatus Falkowbacteria bacterium RIFOXYC12_FULL_34_55]OGF36138.1 MAG: hypothetical protein A2466_03615 [Candidatus Falkowbacteria bacterium RIFOXYC2_FULL_34_220]OGF38590.1 MAG: hypothetical protein A2515_04875 [Candidatus Falkowbacteria bacterium RIFOXYD12_FULL_34_57]OGF40737.1 MAG: hypothetical protein A2531_06880 [Candidatus Falkowbacteria bact
MNKPLLYIGKLSINELLELFKAVDHLSFAKNLEIITKLDQDNILLWNVTIKTDSENREKLKIFIETGGPYTSKKWGDKFIESLFFILRRKKY